MNKIQYGPHNVYGCSAGQSVFGAVREAIEYGRFPKGSYVDTGARVPRNGSPYPTDANIVGQVTVRPHESFFVRCDDYTNNN